MQNQTSDSSVLNWKEPEILHRQPCGMFVLLWEPRAQTHLGFMTRRKTLEYGILCFCFLGKLRCSFLLRAKAYNWLLFAIIFGNLGSEVAYTSNKQERARMDICTRASDVSWHCSKPACGREGKGTTFTLAENFISVSGPLRRVRECGGWRVHVSVWLAGCLALSLHVSWASSNTILSLFWLGPYFEGWPQTCA